jgi:hypothetical protein
MPLHDAPCAPAVVLHGRPDADGDVENSRAAIARRMSAPASRCDPDRRREVPQCTNAARATQMTDEIAVFDIDGTLADVSERLHHVRAKPKNWNAFFAAMAQDKAIASIVRLCNLLHDAGVRVVLCSGRPERYRSDTVAWLAREGVGYDELRLRRDGDRRSDAIAKREMLADIDRTRVLFIVEDRSSVVEMWRAQGFVCLQCAPGES